MFEELLGTPIEGKTNADPADLLQIRFPADRPRRFDDLCRDLQEQSRPTVAIDLRDRKGMYRAMIASGAAVRSGEEMVGVVLLFTDVTGLLRANGAART